LFELVQAVLSNYGTKGHLNLREFALLVADIKWFQSQPAGAAKQPFGSPPSPPAVSSAGKDTNGVHVRLCM